MAPALPEARRQMAERANARGAYESMWPIHTINVLYWLTQNDRTQEMELFYCLRNTSIQDVGGEKVRASQGTKM